MDYEGEFIKLNQAYCRPTPVQEPAPPIVVGAARPIMLDLVGRKADVWNCPSGLIPRLKEARERVLNTAAGRPIRTTLQIPVAVGRSTEEAAAALEVGRVHMEREHLERHGGVPSDEDECSANRRKDGLAAFHSE